ncbi:anti-sigma factor domain-containing protein [Persicitalea sp.]|uniref:anti-sigma factor n=1 Tax=Persicitalea sp. TaxID=3100273 RepID=UPI00359341E6
MNISAYIDSGILEEYALGIVSPQEKQEVECLTQVYPELKAELELVEKALEQYALQHGVPVPGRVKDTIFTQMKFGPAASAAAADASPADIKEEGRTIEYDTTPIQEDARVTRPLWGTLGIAASVLLAIFGAWAAYQYSTTRSENEQLAVEVENLNEQTNTLQQRAEYNEALAANYRNPDVKIVNMPGLEKAPDSEVVALWNQKTNEVLLDVQNLPAPPTGKQYQLWTIVDGKPVDMGMLDDDFMGKLLRMKASSPNAAAFAITLEDDGGKPSPTMEEMVVMGKV